MVRNYTDAQLLKRVKEIPGFKEIPANYWILGVRSNEDVSNEFDDKFYIFNGTKFIMVMHGTTHPGLTILKDYSKFNDLGAAVVKADKWYYNLWVYGMHRGKMPALLQLGSKITVFRDGNKNSKSEQIGREYEGYYGINFHLNNYDFTDLSQKKYINGWSAGCQVPNDTKKYTDFIALAKASKQKFSYCLINEFNP